MDDDVFNMEVRRFLKQLGVTSQREIERAVRDGLAAGALAGDTPVRVSATVTIEGLDLHHAVAAELKLD